MTDFILNMAIAGALKARIRRITKRPSRYDIEIAEARTAYYPTNDK